MFLKFHGIVFEDSEDRFCSFTRSFHSYFTSPNVFSLFTDLTSFLPNFATSCSPTVASSSLVLSPFPFKHSFYLPLTLLASLRTFLSPSLLSLTCCSSHLHLVWPPDICSLLLCCLTSLDDLSVTLRCISLYSCLLSSAPVPCLLIKPLSCIHSCTSSSHHVSLSAFFLDDTPSTCLSVLVVTIHLDLSQPLSESPQPPVLASTTSSSAPPVCSKTLLSDHELFLFMVGPQ